MKLQQIVAYINLLDSLSMDSECREAVRVLDSILHVVTSRIAIQATESNT